MGETQQNSSQAQHDYGKNSAIAKHIVPGVTDKSSGGD